MSAVKDKISLRRKLLLKEAERITQKLAGLGVQKVILFGSLGKGRVHSGSDLDLLVVWDTELRFMDRLDVIYRTVSPAVALDLLVYTPEEFAELVRTRPFIRQIVNEGKILYEARARSGS
ncbi:nucleotidyltransferase domain-containing protein [Thermanaeromonas sp. C210]|uniref:nucleotidyltransferase domain-containing protein n=1 Tax=Thermanaeromonas sp. C210 TaxID=2731925 RepID=UPI00155BEB8C|nr:nucleotidyltransferase domain-containing protein [Thermanaeromonas sp. C210]GFN23145.1 hypothetical protein TAMC210_14620 [Thermanaeromonas sp. C210]